MLFLKFISSWEKRSKNLLHTYALPIYCCSVAQSCLTFCNMQTKMTVIKEEVCILIDP